MPTTRCLTTCLILAALLAGPAAAQLATDNEVVAIVNKKVITRYDIMESFAKDEIDFSKLSESEQTIQFRRRVRSRVLDMLHEDATVKAGVTVSEEDLLNQKTRFIEQSFGTEGAFNDFLSDQGLSEEEFDTDFRKRQEAVAWLRVVSGSGGGKLSRTLRPRFDLSVTPREIRDYYKQHVQDEFTHKNEAQVRVIKVYFRHGPRGNMAQVKQRLLGLKQKLKTKADFAVLAQKYSEHPSKENGGLLPVIEKGRGDLLPEPIEEAVFEAGVKKGDVVGPIKHVNAYWLVKVEARQEARLIPFDEAQGTIRIKMQIEKRNRALAKVQLELVHEAYISPTRLKRELEAELSRRWHR